MTCAARNPESASQNLGCPRSFLCCRKTSHSRKQVQNVNPVHRSGTFIPVFAKTTMTAARTSRQTSAIPTSLAASKAKLTNRVRSLFLAVLIEALENKTPRMKARFYPNRRFRVLTTGQFMLWRCRNSGVSCCGSTSLSLSFLVHLPHLPWGD